MTTRSHRRPENLQRERRNQTPTNDRGPGVRLSSGPEHNAAQNRPFIVTQSDLRSSPPEPLQFRGSPYSPGSAGRDGKRSAAVAAPLPLETRSPLCIRTRRQVPSLPADEIGDRRVHYGRVGYGAHVAQIIELDNLRVWNELTMRVKYPACGRRRAGSREEKGRHGQVGNGLAGVTRVKGRTRFEQVESGGLGQRARSNPIRAIDRDLDGDVDAVGMAHQVEASRPGQAPSSVVRAQWSCS